MSRKKDYSTTRIAVTDPPRQRVVLGSPVTAGNKLLLLPLPLLEEDQNDPAPPSSGKKKINPSSGRLNDSPPPPCADFLSSLLLPVYCLSALMTDGMGCPRTHTSTHTILPDFRSFEVFFFSQL
jgi:hypothetical protein